MKLITENFKTHMAAQFVESVSETSNSNYYVFAARSLPFTDDEAPPSPNTALYETSFSLYDEMLFGKKVTSADIKHMIRNIPWVTGTVYDNYDHADTTLSSKNFYVVSESGGDYSVFKCLDNNDGVPSTAKPLLSETSAEDEFYQTSDGYQWKYMFTVDAANYAKFATDDYLPVIANTSVTANAIAGSLETFRIDNAGVNYNSYASGFIKEAAVAGNTLIFSLSSGTVRVTCNNVTDLVPGTVNFKYANGDSIYVADDGVTLSSAVITNVKGAPDLTIDLEAVNGVSIQDGYLVVQGAVEKSVADVQVIGNALSSNTDFYKNNTFYIRSGTGAGQVRTVAEYTVTGNERRIFVDSAFSTLPDTTSFFEIGPRVSITGDGSGAAAIAVVNTTANSISTIEVVTAGTGYTYANVSITANTGLIVSGSVVSANTAVVKPIISPPGGHGSDVINEFYANKVGISVQFANSEANTISIANDYRKVGLLKDPKFANAELFLTTSTASSFTDGETIIHYMPQSSNTLLKTYTYTLNRYQTATVSATTGFDSADRFAMTDSSDNEAQGVVLETSGSDILLLRDSGDTLIGTGDILTSGNSSITPIIKRISSITAADPAVVTTTTAHGIANAAPVIFSSITEADMIIDDTGATTYYAKYVSNTTFEVYSDVGLSTSVDNSANTAGADGYVSTGTNITDVSAVAYTHTGLNARVAGKDDYQNRFVFTPWANRDDDVFNLTVELNGTEVSSNSTTTGFTAIGETIDPTTDSIVAKIFSTQEGMLTEDYLGRTTAEVSNRSGNILRLRNIRGDFSSNTQIKGLSSGTVATINSISRSFNTFSQLTEMPVTITDTGSANGVGNTGFNYDDLVTQTEGQYSASGYVHSISDIIRRYVTSITQESPPIVTTSIAHTFANGDNITFSGLDGTALDDDTSPTRYFVANTTSTTFKVYTNAGLTTPFDNSANTTASTGIVSGSRSYQSGNRTIYLTNVKGIFNVSDVDTDKEFINTTGATAKITGRIDPDLVDNSGEIIYIENMSPVTRANDQTDKIKLIFEF